MGSTKYFIILFFVIYFYLFYSRIIFFLSGFEVDLVGGRLSASNRYRGSRESLQSGMTYSARKNSQSSMYNGTNIFSFYF